jgi:hypothetical protein
MAWLVTLPDEFATGDAVAETPPTLSASATVGDTRLADTKLIIA